MYFTGGDNDVLSSFLDKNFDTRIGLVEQLQAV